MQDRGPRDCLAIHLVLQHRPVGGRADYFHLCDGILPLRHEDRVLRLGASHRWVPRERHARLDGSVGESGVRDPLAAEEGGTSSLVVLGPLVWKPLGGVRVLNLLEHLVRRRSHVPRGRNSDRVDISRGVVATQQLVRDLLIGGSGQVHHSCGRANEPVAAAAQHEHELVLDALLRRQRVANRVGALVRGHQQHHGGDLLGQQPRGQRGRGLPLAHAGLDASSHLADDAAALGPERAERVHLVVAELDAQVGEPAGQLGARRVHQHLGAGVARCCGRELGRNLRMRPLGVPRVRVDREGRLEAPELLVQQPVALDLVCEHADGGRVNVDRAHTP